MPTFLETVVERTQSALAERKRILPASELEQRLGPARRGRPFSEGLIDEGISLIAEMKRSSPSKGPIRPGASVSEVVRAYQEAGARAVSVLTESEFFGGSLDDLVEARAACDLPLLRKDFVVDEYQLLEARAAGADAILLIVSALSDLDLAALLGATRELGLEALVEAHDADEVARAVAAGAGIIGINNRDLRTFTVDRELAARLRPRVPDERVIVAESGIRDAGDVGRLRAAGIDAILVGETLMRAPDPTAALRALLAS